MSDAHLPHTRFATFFPFYLGEHRHPVCRILHFVGTSLSLACLLQVFLMSSMWWFLAAVCVGYLCAWAGHFIFEKNKPTSFKQPVYSFIADWVMWFQLLTGKIPFNPTQNQ